MATLQLYGFLPNRSPRYAICKFHLRIRVRQFHLKFYFAYKWNEAKLDLFRMCFACSLVKLSAIIRFFSLPIFRFASTELFSLRSQTNGKPFFSLQNTYLSLKIHFVFTFFANYSRIDFFTLILHVFNLIHTHIDTPVQALGWYSHTSVHIFSFQDTFCSYILCRLQ